MVPVDFSSPGNSVLSPKNEGAAHLIAKAAVISELGGAALSPRSSDERAGLQLPALDIDLALQHSCVRCVYDESSSSSEFDESDESTPENSERAFFPDKFRVGAALLVSKILLEKIDEERESQTKT